MGIAAHDSQVFHLRLGDQESVEGIAVVTRKLQDLINLERKMVTTDFTD